MRPPGSSVVEGSGMSWRAPRILRRLDALPDPSGSILPSGYLDFDDLDRAGEIRSFPRAARPPPDAGSLPPPRTLTIILPALNEERGVRDVLSRIPRAPLEAMGIAFDVVLLDGRSTDHTRDMARHHGARVFVQRGKGKGAALQELIPTLGSDYCVILDSDGSYPPEAIPTLVEELVAGKPVVVGSRFLGSIDDGAINGSNLLGNRVLTRFASLLYANQASDVCSGMWAFNTEVLRRFRLTAESFDIEADFFAETSANGLPMVEVPISYRKRIGVPKLRLRAGIRIAWTLMVKRLQSPRGTK